MGGDARHGAADRQLLCVMLFRNARLLARALRRRFEETGVFVVSLVSSPGSGKTAFLERTLTLLREGGLDRRSVTPEEIRSIEPTLQGDFHGGFFTPSDSTGDIHKFTRGLADACARHGVEFRYDTAVESIHEESTGRLVVASETQGQRDTAAFDSLVICAGVGSRARSIRAMRPLGPMTGMERRLWSSASPVASIRSRKRRYSVQQRAGCQGGISPADTMVPMSAA